MEHKRAANNTPSDPENSIGQHYFGKNHLVAFALVYAMHTKHSKVEDKDLHFTYNYFNSLIILCNFTIVLS